MEETVGSRRPGRWRPVLAGVALVLVAASVPWVAAQLADGSASRGDRATAAVARPRLTDNRPPFVAEPRVTLEAAAAVPPPAKPAVAPAVGRPVRLVVPRLGVNAPVIDIGVVDGVLLPPSDPQTLGWWSSGAKPGAVRGGALITGHTVHSGGGAFDDLETLDEGDRVQVRTDRGTLRYDVTGVTIYRKASLARDAAKVFSQEVPGRLVLITCEDWNGTGYDSNAIVFAEPAPA